MAGKAIAESFGIKAGCHCFHFVVSLINAKMECSSEWILIAFEIRTFDGKSNEIAVTTEKRRRILIKASLISFTIKILFPAKNFGRYHINQDSPNDQDQKLLPA